MNLDPKTNRERIRKLIADIKDENREPCGNLMCEFYDNTVANNCKFYVRWDKFALDECPNYI